MMNKGTLISFFICISILSSTTQLVSTLNTAEAKSSALQATVDQIVQHVSILIESRPNSKKNIVVHLAAIISSIINCVAKIVACPNKQRDSFYHELNTKLQKVLTECAVDIEMEVDEMRAENRETY